MSTRLRQRKTASSETSPRAGWWNRGLGNWNGTIYPELSAGIVTWYNRVQEYEGGETRAELLKIINQMDSVACISIEDMQKLENRVAVAADVNSFKAWYIGHFKGSAPPKLLVSLRGDHLKGSYYDDGGAATPGWQDVSGGFAGPCWGGLRVTGHTGDTITVPSTAQATPRFPTSCSGKTSWDHVWDTLEATSPTAWVCYGRDDYPWAIQMSDQLFSRTNGMSFTEVRMAISDSDWREAYLNYAAGCISDLNLDGLDIQLVKQQDYDGDRTDAHALKDLPSDTTPGPTRMLNQWFNDLSGTQQSSCSPPYSWDYETSIGNGDPDFFDTGGEPAFDTLAESEFDYLDGWMSLVNEAVAHNGIPYIALDLNGASGFGQAWHEIINNAMVTAWLAANPGVTQTTAGAVDDIYSKMEAIIDSVNWCALNNDPDFLDPWSGMGSLPSTPPYPPTEGISTWWNRVAQKSHVQIGNMGDSTDNLIHTVFIP